METAMNHLPFLVEVQTNAGYIMRRMRNNNLEIRIAGSTCRPPSKKQQIQMTSQETCAAKLSFSDWCISILYP